MREKSSGGNPEGRQKRHVQSLRWEDKRDNEAVKAPFPYFGGKSKIAPTVWRLLGNPDHYLEPFFGSGAVLLSRENWQGKTETICDKDGFVANVWRSIAFSPDEVAKWCDWPVNHADLMARKAELIRKEQHLLDGLVSDPKWHDPELAGYWVWAVSCSIGTGFTGTGSIPDLSNKGKGVIAMNDTSFSIGKLSERLRNVRVVCGDFTRILGGDWQDGHWKNVGLFFDPPDDRILDKRLYKNYEPDISERVEKWCLKRGHRKNHSIIVAGYDTEYSGLVDAGWTTHAWKANGGYSNRNGDNANRHRETLFISPHCAKPEKQLELF
jgi:DNA adenine methylase